MSFYDDAKFMFLAGGAAGKDGKAYSIKPEEELTGNDKIINGDFSQDAGGTGGLLQVNVYDAAVGWNLTGDPGTGQVSKITDGKLIMETGDANALAYAHNGTNRDILTENGTYKLTYTVKSISSSSVSLRSYWDAGYRPIENGVGTHSVYFEHNSASTNKLFLFSLNSSNASVEIDDVSLFKVSQEAKDFTFTRGTNLTATRVGKDGYIEKGRENLLLQSNQFDTTWTDPNADVTSGYAGRDGSNDAWELSLTGTFGQTAQAVSASGVNTLSFYAKSGTSDFTRPYIAGPNKYAYFDLLNGQTGAQTGVASSIEDAGNGWWRCSFTVEGTITEVRLHVADSINTIGTSTSGTIYIQDAQLERGLVATEYIETGATTAKAGLLEDEPRFDYTGGGCPALLMEPTRTNKQTHSEYVDSWSTLNLSLTTNAAKSPEGVKNASKIVESTDTGLHRFNKQWTFVDGTIYSLSFFAKAAGRNKIEVKYGTNTVANFHATFTLDGTDPVNIGDGTASMQSMGDGWYRCKIENIEGHRLDTGDIHPESLSTAFNILLHNDANPTENSYEGDGSSGVLIYGFQQEEGAFATSYIPTLGAAATRAKEGSTDSYDQTSVLDLSSSGLDGEDVSWFFELKNNQDVVRDGGGLSIRVSSNTSNLGSFRIYRSHATNTRRMAVVFQDTGSNFTPSGYETTSENPKILVRRTWSTGRIQVHVDGASVIDGTDSDYNRWYKLELAGEGSTLEVKQVIAFDEVLSTNDSEIITGTSYTNFAAMASELSYTEYE